MVRTLEAVAIAVVTSSPALASSSAIRAIAANDKIVAIEGQLAAKGYDLEAIVMTAPESPHNLATGYSVKFKRCTQGSQTSAVEILVFVERDLTITVPDFME